MTRSDQDPVRILVTGQLLQLEQAPTGPQLHEDLISNLRDPAAIREQLARIQQAVMSDDPPLVIGSAKELIESTAKAVLIERGLTVNEKEDLPPFGEPGPASPWDSPLGSCFWWPFRVRAGHRGSPKVL